MLGKDLVLNALQNKETPRVPWVPFVGCHAAKLIGVDCEKYFNDSDLIVEGVCKAKELYQPDGLPVLFDLQVEAEALGCRLRYADNNPPSVASHPLAEGTGLEDLRIPSERDGRFGLVMTATRKLKKLIGEDVALYGLITGPFTLALHLMGTEIFYEMIDNPDKVQRVLGFCADVCVATSKMYIEAGVDVVAVVDPMTSQISPKNYSEFVAPYLQPIYSCIRERGKLCSLFVCGNATNNIELMCQGRPDNISIDENVSLEYARKLCDQYGISLGGNIQLTVSMLFGTPADNIQDAKNCIQVGGTRGYILSPGCDLPYNTPIENVKAITAIVQGNVAEVFGEISTLDTEVVLPDYYEEPKVIIDVITLDSEACAPCQYMVAAVTKAVAGLEDKVEWREHKVKEKLAVATMLQLGVKNIPTICIDGVISYVSIIPPVEELRASIASAIEEKAIDRK